MIGLISCQAKEFKNGSVASTTAAQLLFFVQNRQHPSTPSELSFNAESESAEAQAFFDKLKIARE